jgi:hypothetical protein
LYAPTSYVPVTADRHRMRNRRLHLLRRLRDFSALPLLLTSACSGGPLPFGPDASSSSAGVPDATRSDDTPASPAVSWDGAVMPPPVDSAIACHPDVSMHGCPGGQLCNPVGICQPCGQAGQRCCPVAAADGGNASEICTDQKASCLGDPGSATCTPCGAIDGICCKGKTCSDPGTACLAMPPMGFRCRRCGGPSEPSCP